MSLVSNFEILMRFPLEGFSFNPENKPGMEVISNDRNRTIRVNPCQPDEDGFGHRLGLKTRIVCSVLCDANQHRFISNFIDGIVERREGVPDFPILSHGEISVDEGGRCQKGVGFWFDWFPPDIKLLVDKAIDQAWYDFDRLFRILRWQQNSPMRIPSRSAHALSYWRTSGEGLFHLIPQRSSEIRAFPDRETGWIGWDEPERDDFSNLWSNPAIDEPLGHELQNEAELLVERAPRSALLMATAAVEAGVKDHIGRIAPLTEWLVREMPSPPVGKILKQYIPLIHGDNSRIEIWGRFKKLFDKFENDIVRKKNKTAHVGAMITSVEMWDYLQTTRDILYLLDYLEGFDWTLHHISLRNRTLAELPMPPQRYVQAEISVHSGPGIGS